MPIPPNNTNSSSTNGSLNAAVLTLDNTSAMFRVVLSGTYTGVTGTIDVSTDNSTWINKIAIDESAATGSVVAGTLSPSASNKSYLGECDGWAYVRFNPTAVSTGTLVATVYGANSLSNNLPVQQITSSTTSFTNGSFSGTLSAGGAVTFTSTLAVTSTSTLSGAVTTGSTVSLGGTIFPTTNDVGALGTASNSFADLFLASGGVINIANGNWVATHTSGILTVGTGDLRVTTAGTNAASVVTVGGTQTLTNKTLTSPTMTAPVLGVATGTSLAVTGLITSSSATAGIGYATGAGGAVTQGTSRTTGVTVNAVSGAITLVSAAGSTTPASFTVTNSTVAATDTVTVSQKSGTDLYHTLVTAVGAGSFRITFFTTGGTTTEQPVFNFNVFKGVAS